MIKSDATVLKKWLKIADGLFAQGRQAKTATLFGSFRLSATTFIRFKGIIIWRKMEFIASLAERDPT